MCGIIGKAGKDEDAVKKAAATFKYRGPDSSGFYADERVTFGMNRLAIIDLDPRSNQPLWNADRTLALVFNGEIYNYRELREELKKLGYAFHTEGDGEVILAAYQHWRERAVERLEGIFALCIYDLPRGELFLAVDNEAIKPLYYAKQGDFFAFSSEIKGIISLARSAGVTLETDRKALELYWAFGYIPAPQTLYTNVYRCLPRTRARYTLATGKLALEQYPERTAKEPSIAELKELIKRKVKAQLIADVPVGVFFSGGTDSSLIVAILHELGVNLKTFSVRVEGRGEDRKYFDAIAKHLALKTHVYDFGVTEFDETYERVRKEIDEPMYDNSLYPTAFIAKKAREEVTVVLSGEGGDEFFDGYYRSIVLNRLHGASLDRTVGVFEHLYFLLPAFRGKNYLFERLYAFVRRPVAYYVLTMSPSKSLMTRSMWKRAKEAVTARAKGARDFDASLYLSNDLLRKTDEATMYASLEGRVPLLDPDIIAAARALPAPDLSKTTKPVLKDILADYLPRELVYRGKSGFGLSPAKLFTESRHLRADIAAAIDYLKEHKLLPLKPLPSTQRLEQSYPQLCFALLSLYHAHRNAERW